MPPLGRVTIAGIGVVTTGHTYYIAGCGQAAASLPPCVTGKFTVGTARVRSMGLPLAISPPAGPSFCQPNTTPLIPAPAGQTRVYAA